MVIIHNFRDQTRLPIGLKQLAGKSHAPEKAGQECEGVEKTCPEPKVVIVPTIIVVAATPSSSPRHLVGPIVNDPTCLQPNPHPILEINLQEHLDSYERIDEDSNRKILHTYLYSFIKTYR